MRRVVQVSKRPDVVEVVQLCLEALVKWDRSSSDATEDLNMALEELRRTELGIKAIERSMAEDDALNLFLTDGTSYRLSVRRTDNSFR